MAGRPYLPHTATSETTYLLPRCSLSVSSILLLRPPASALGTSEYTLLAQANAKESGNVPDTPRSPRVPDSLRVCSSCCVMMFTGRCAWSTTKKEYLLCVLVGSVPTGCVRKPMEPVFEGVEGQRSPCRGTACTVNFPRISLLTTEKSMAPGFSCSTH